LQQNYKTVSRRQGQPFERQTWSTSSAHSMAHDLQLSRQCSEGVMSNDPHAHVWHTRGKQEMHKLAVGTFAALHEAQLADRLESLHARIFDRSPQDLMDVVLID